ncbi:MAG: Hsp20/alpha crystallin family protein [Rhizobacter sp.]|nr:Hsp20/alpha crystallin family protein [Rhizobacter sp.]
MFASILNYPDSVFSQFDRLRRELDEVFTDSRVPSSIRSVAYGSAPPLNVGRTPRSVEVYAFAPGLDASKIDVTLDRGVLRISGERAADLPEKDAKTTVYARERSVGRFTRSVALPDDVDPNQVTATYRDGVLQVSIARKEAAQPKRITVQ